MHNGHQPEKDGSGSKKALVISVSDYSNNLQPLDFCKNDGDEIYKVLKSIGYEIPDSHKLVGQVKYETMKDVIYDFFTDANTKAEDTLIFYYSGHGVPDVNGDVFLASSELNPDAPFRKGFSFYELTNTIERSNSTRIVTILDCCYSGAAKISKGHEEDAAKLGTAAIDDQSKKLLQQGEGKCLLAASHGYQEAYGLKEKGHSIFTYYLLEGFKGSKKAIDEEGNVTPDTLGKYVYREIVNLPEGKRPKQKPIRKVEAGGDIILAQFPELVKKEQTQDPYELIQDATEHLKRGDHTTAIQSSDNAIAINPRIAIAYVIKGLALFNLTRYDEALSCYDKALEVRPKYLEAINNKALTFVAIEKYDAAIEAFNQSTNLNPNDANIWNSKGVTFSTLGKYEDGIDCFEKAIKLNPNYTEALKNEHQALSNLRKQQQGQEQPKKAVYSSSPLFSSLGNDLRDTTLTEKIKTEVSTGQPTQLKVEENILQPQARQESDELRRSVSPISTDISQSTKNNSNSVIKNNSNSVIEGNRRKQEKYYSAAKKQPQQKNLKLLIPIVISAIVVSVIVLGVFSTTTTPPDTTTTPPDTTVDTTNNNTFTNTLNIYPLTIGDKSYTIKYRIDGRGNELNSIESNPPSDDSLSMVVSSKSDGILTTEIPRNLLDSKTEGKINDNLRVLLDGNESYSFHEIISNSNVRTLEIPFKKGIKYIGIFPNNFDMKTYFTYLESVLAERNKAMQEIINNIRAD